MEIGYSFDITKYEYLEKVGKGSFGTVYKVKEKETGEIYACKVSHQPYDKEESSKETIRDLVREVNILSKMNHPLIVKFVGFSLTDIKGNPNPSLVTEFIPKKSLSYYINLERQSRADNNWTDTQKTHYQLIEFLLRNKSKGNKMNLYHNSVHEYFNNSFLISSVSAKSIAVL